MDLNKKINKLSNEDGTHKKSTSLLPNINSSRSITLNKNESTTKEQNIDVRDVFKFPPIRKHMAEYSDIKKENDKSSNFKQKLPILETRKDESLSHKFKSDNVNVTKNDNKLPKIKHEYNMEKENNNQEYDEMQNAKFLPKLNNFGNEKKGDIQMKTQLSSLPSINLFDKVDSKSKFKNNSHDKNREHNIREKISKLPSLSNKNLSTSPNEINKIDHVEPTSIHINSSLNEIKSTLSKRDYFKRDMKKESVRFSKLNNHHQIKEIQNSQFMSSLLSNLSDEEKSLKEKSLSKERNQKQYRFDFKKAEYIIGDVLENFSLGHYSNEIKNASIGIITTFLSDLIKDKIKEISDNQHKLVVLVTFYNQENQGIIIASKCLWDNQNDSWVTVRQNYKSYIIIATLYAVAFL
jgi:hypothetical protein